MKAHGEMIYFREISFRRLNIPTVKCGYIRGNILLPIITEREC